MYNNLSWVEMDVYILSEVDFFEMAGPHIDMVEAHCTVVDHLLSRKNMKLTLRLASFSTLALARNFCTFFGVDPTQTHRLNRNEPLEVPIPVQDFNFIALKCKLIPFPVLVFYN